MCARAAILPPFIMKINLVHSIYLHSFESLQPERIRLARGCHESHPDQLREMKNKIVTSTLHHLHFFRQTEIVVNTISLTAFYRKKKNIFV